MMHPSRQTLTNSIIVIMIAAITLGVMLLSFASKAARYEADAGIVPLTVQKKEYKITAQTIGTVSGVTVTAGQRIKKGAVLARLTNEVLDKQISLLTDLSANNPSASIELVNLLTQKAAQTIYAPTDGVVASIVTEGQAVNTLQDIATIYSDTSVQLVGTFSLANYDLLQRNNGSLSIQNKRLHSDYPVVYSGTLQEVATTNNPNHNISLSFTMSSPDDAANMLQNEQVGLLLLPKHYSTKPIDRFIDWYKEHVLDVDVQ